MINRMYHFIIWIRFPVVVFVILDCMYTVCKLNFEFVSVPFSSAQTDLSFGMPWFNLEGNCGLWGFLCLSLFLKLTIYQNRLLPKIYYSQISILEKLSSKFSPFLSVIHTFTLRRPSKLESGGEPAPRSRGGTLVVESPMVLMSEAQATGAGSQSGYVLTSSWF